MARPDTIRVELSSADRRLLQRLVAALERGNPPRDVPARLREPATFGPDEFAKKVLGDD